MARLTCTITACSRNIEALGIKLGVVPGTLQERLVSVLNLALSWGGAVSAKVVLAQAGQPS